MDATCTIHLNNGLKQLHVEAGRSLLATLDAAGIYMPSACGGKGACGTCKCRVPGIDAPFTQQENFQLKEPERANGFRLACQLPVTRELQVEVSDIALAARKWTCTVVSNHNVSTFIKELVLKMPAGQRLAFRAGMYIQVDVPPYAKRFAEFDIPASYRDDWAALDHVAESDTATFRAYSMANPPVVDDHIMLNVRIAIPPPGGKVPPGIATTYLFGLRPGDTVVVGGPFGDFWIKETDREMVYIGGGAGMAPLRSHILDLFHARQTTRRVHFWYGARSRREIFYEEEFRALAQRHPNFSFNIALSEPQPEDRWEGPTGFIHTAVLEQMLSKHADPKALEYYLCGPPMMIRAVRKMLTGLGVQAEMIAFDAF